MARFILTLFVIGSCNVTFAQFRYARFDGQFKTGYSTTTFNDANDISYTYRSLGGLFLQVNYYIIPNIAVGIFAERSTGSTVNISAEPSYPARSFNASHHSTGFSLRFSSGLKPLLRSYMGLTWCRQKLSFDFSPFSVIQKLNAIGAEAGVMLKVSNTLYVIPLEVEFRTWLRDNFYNPSDNNVDDPKFFMACKIGITYNLSRIK
jgi:hypothetical protein